ncbi:MAG TPA: 4-alpha-glucanotransferase [Vicinamibacterales bacterium]|jgi:4-alpha-glucanotransferase|nr:4-alpha-glucanotransferase [Vicinamibacterales bacterium]
MSDARSRFDSGRHAGVIAPLFSIPSRESWGIGEIPDLAWLSSWLAAAGLDFVQLLPLNEMEEGQSSPYSALSAMAIDPIYIAVPEVEEFVDAGGELSLATPDRQRLDAARSSEIIDYPAVRVVKTRALRAAFALFIDRHEDGRSARGAAFHAFRDRERWWLADYALFRALHDEHGGRYWLEWEPGLRDRDPAALAAASKRLHTLVRYYEYLQWLADEQWHSLRRRCRTMGIFGDYPFMVNGHSADVWSRQHEFRLDCSVGVPPDAFSETGQDWGLPASRWDVMAAGGYVWIANRARRCAELYDAFRIDHLVGLYRTFVREPDGRKHFLPPDEPHQLAQGEALLGVFRASGAHLIAEDLGVVPDFVRASLARLGLPGLKVLRWERDWHATGHPFHDPAAYAPSSVAITGTHDTETLADWWDGADLAERESLIAIPAIQGTGIDPQAPYSDVIRDALLTAIFSAGSNIVIVPVQDVFGWRERVNTPAVVSDRNWSWRLPWPVDELMTSPQARERAEFLRQLER